MGAHTERDSGILLAHVVALLLGEEHVGGETTLRRVWVCSRVSMDASKTPKMGKEGRSTHPSSSSRLWAWWRAWSWSP
jgi:hypothetical protein